ncbi:MAG: hypothetical protein AABY18_08990 [Candidatus Thermoplasmatota archaeon]
MTPTGRLLPTGSGRGPGDDAITPIIGTMLVFVIIFGGMAGALVFGVPAITGLQDRAAVDDMATQLEAVRREAERLTVEGAGASVALAPSQGSVNLEEGTRMAVAISYDGTSSQQGLALAWGKGGKKKNTSNAPQDCDAHIQDWADSDNQVTLVASDCSTPMRWDPADAGTGSTLVQSLAVTAPVTATAGWVTATEDNLATSNNLYAEYATDIPKQATVDLVATVADPGSTPDDVAEVIIKAEVSIVDDTPSSDVNDGFKLKVCLAAVCSTESGNGQGSSALDNVISFDATNRHPDGGSVDWVWADILAMEAGLELTQGSGRDGTWRVDRIWVEVTSEPSAPSGGNSGKCYNTSGAVCLQGFKTSDATGVNRVSSVAAVAGQDDTYLLTLDAPLEGDWYFQISKDPRVPETDQLLAKAYIFGMDQLRWVRDEGLTTWLEGGAVFASRKGTHYLHGAPIFDESITGRLLGNLTYYVRIIRFQGDEASISGTGTTNVLLRHNSTLSTTNDGIVGARFDFHGEGAELWCNALMRRDVPTNYYYAEHEFDDDGASETRCDGHPSTGVQGVKYGAQSSLCNGLTDPQLTQCRRENPLYFQMLFTEVLFDVTLLP